MNSGRRAVLCWLPAALAGAYALWAFFPQREGLAGFGDDPTFNAWHFLHLFRTFDAHGPLAAFGRAAWNAPIQAPGELRLALSENQLWPALLLWPLWRLTGELVTTLNLGLLLLHLAAFACGAAWLGARGVRELRFWGGLLLSLCGFLQCHYAHWQNACIFLLPLALLAFDRLRERPGPWRALVCGAAFGWISGWNVYYFLLGGVLLAGLLLHARLQRARPLPAASIALVLAAIALVNLPVLPRYAELAGQVAGYGAWEYFPAGWASVLARPERASWLETRFSWWPRAQGLGIEAAGFTGFTWLLLAALALTRPRLRWPLAAAALAFWASLGPGYGLYDLLGVLPGFSGLRAVGRLQLGFTLGTLLAVVTLLEEQRGLRRWLPVALVLLELWPAGPALRVRLARAIDGPLTPLEQALAADPAPVLVLDEVSPLVQLAVLRSGAGLFGGYSGRAPAGGDLLYDRAVRRRESSLALVRLTGATRVLVAAPGRLPEARASAWLRERGCYDALGAGVCLFDVQAALVPPLEGRPLRLAADTETRLLPTTDGVALELWATRAGPLDFTALGGCRVERLLRLPGPLSLLPALRLDLGLEGRGFPALWFAPGALVYRKVLRGPWSRWPAWLRPGISARLSCG